MTDFDSHRLLPRRQRCSSDPYPYFDHLRSQCPVRREPHHDVVMVTGYDEAMAVYHDTADLLVVQLGHRSVPRLPRPARGRRRQRADRAAPRRAAR